MIVPDASINVQDAFNKLEKRILAMEKRLPRIGEDSATKGELDQLREDVKQATSEPTYEEHGVPHHFLAPVGLADGLVTLLSLFFNDHDGTGLFYDSGIALVDGGEELAQFFRNASASYLDIRDSDNGEALRIYKTDNGNAYILQIGDTARALYIGSDVSGGQVIFRAGGADKWRLLTGGDLVPQLSQKHS